MASSIRPSAIEMRPSAMRARVSAHRRPERAELAAQPSSSAVTSSTGCSSVICAKPFVVRAMAWPNASRGFAEQVGGLLETGDDLGASVDRPHRRPQVEEARDRAGMRRCLGRALEQLEHPEADLVEEAAQPPVQVQPPRDVGREIGVADVDEMPHRGAEVAALEVEPAVRPRAGRAPSSSGAIRRVRASM